MCNMATNMLTTLKRYKELADDSDNRATLIKDVFMIQFLAFALDGTTKEVASTALATLEALSESLSAHPTLRTTYGVMEALDSLSRKNSPDPDWEDLAKRAAHLAERLEDSKNLTWQQPKNVKLFIPHLQQEDCNSVWSVLSAVPGVVSCNFDMQNLYCNLTVFSSLDPILLAQTVHAKTGLEPKLVIKNDVGTEIFRSLLRDEPDEIKPQYLSDLDTSIVGDKAVATRSTVRQAASWLGKAAEYVVQSFYW